MSDDTPTTENPAVGSNQLLDYAQGDGAALVTSLDRLDDAEALCYEHPDYAANRDKWLKYVNCYLARDMASYIHKHVREHNDVYQERLKRGYYYNYVASIVDLFVAYLFESGITREVGGKLKEDFAGFYADATRSGVGYPLLMKMAETFAMVGGHCGILVDLPEAPEGGYPTRADEKAADHRPYLTLVRASQILDWELNDRDQFEWVKLEVVRPQNRNWRTPVDTDVRHFLIWTRGNWELFQVKDHEDQESSHAKRVDGGDHELGEVPLVILRNEVDLDHSWMGLSAVRDIADINLAILNWSSMADEEIYNRCLNILTMQRTENDPPVEISQYNVLEYEEGADPPAFLTPGETPLMLIGKQIDRARDEIYRLAKMGGSTGLLGVREATSGIAYAFEFNETNQSLAGKAGLLEKAERDVHRLVGKWWNTDVDATITYPREFGVDDFLLEFQMLTEARATLTSESALKAMEKKLTAKLFTKDSQKFRQKVEEEIERGASRLGGQLQAAMNFGSVSPTLLGRGSRNGDQEPAVA